MTLRATLARVLLVRSPKPHWSKGRRQAKCSPPVLGWRLGMVLTAKPNKKFLVMKPHIKNM
jgi:hypothetical protein